MATVTHIQKDWEQREFIAEMTTNVKKLVDFLNNFGASLSEQRGRRLTRVAHRPLDAVSAGDAARATGDVGAASAV